MFNKLSNFKYKTKILPFILYFTIISFVILLIATNNYTMSTNRVTDGFHEVHEMEMKYVEDKESPLGVSKVYNFEIDDYHTNANCIAFQVVHHYARVYIVDELVYSFYPNNDYRVAKTLGCEWLIVPIVYGDTGKMVTVELMPLYEDVVEQEVKIYHGSQYDIFMSILVKDVLWMIIGLVCFGIGVIFIVNHVYAKIHRNAHKKSQLYLGLIAIALACWKLFNLDLASLFLGKNPRLLFYVSYISLLLAPLPFVKYVECLTSTNKNTPIRIVFISYLVFLLVALSLQLYSLFDIRRNIFIMMIAIVAVIIITLVIVIFQGGYSIKKKGTFKQMIPLFLAILSIGGIIDIIIYLISGTTNNLIFTFISFFIYSLMITIYSSGVNSDRQYRDFQTGLYNSNSCKEYIEDNNKLNNCAAIMFDLNGLKATNDKFGHHAGDLLIIDFTTILKKSIPLDDFIGRTGGDEFIAIIHQCNQEKINKIVETIEKSLDEVNVDRVIKLSFSYGWALSEEHDCDLSELIKIADKKMYEHKNQYYKNKQ